MQQDATGAATRISFLDHGDARVSAASAENLLLLGLFRGVRCVLLELDANTPEWAQADAARGECFAELRPLACNLERDDAGLLA